MPLKHIFNPVAASEYENAFEWYEQKSSKVADNFVAAVEQAILLACTYPERYRNTYKNFREISLKKYPFSLVYYFDLAKEIIVIVSVYHHKRNPKWKFIKPKTNPH
ncbi:MAG: type II toxin-antitoxin system RelE/ParE family toxin [Niabella sp.]|nr:type II toxin-antitoxin system RelE/ParE family toxin [Niabella sp.]